MLWTVGWGRGPGAGWALEGWPVEVRELGLGFGAFVGNSGFCFRVGFWDGGVGLGVQVW